MPTIRQRLFRNSVIAGREKPQQLDDRSETQTKRKYICFNTFSATAVEFFDFMSYKIDFCFLQKLSEQKMCLKKIKRPLKEVFNTIDQQQQNSNRENR